jgi:hypothetical protein
MDWRVAVVNPRGDEKLTGEEGNLGTDFRVSLTLDPPKRSMASGH